MLHDILRGEVTFAGAVDLSVNIGAVRLRNPILAASGTFGYGLEFSHLVDLNSLAGFVTKGISLEPIQGSPAPRLCETPSGMLNAVGLQNVGVKAFIAEKLPVLRKYDTQLIVNVFGYSPEEYVDVIRLLEPHEGIAAYELNISCPNVKCGGMQFGSDPALVAQVVAAAKKAALRRPLWVKLSPLVTDIGLIAHAAQEAGADALTIANTYPAMAIDPLTGKSLIGSRTGGLSGPAIKPITLRLVWEASRRVHIPIIGLGGVETVGDVLQYIAVGAAAVQIGTATFAEPRAAQQLARGLSEALTDSNCHGIKEMRQKIQVNFS